MKIFQNPVVKNFDDKKKIEFFFIIEKKYFFSELKKILRYSFDAEKVDLSIGGIFRLIGDV